MTHRLYYDDPYLKTFEAEVMEVKKEADGYHVRLNRSAFYPTSGGQPFDMGVLESESVLNVYPDDTGAIWHVLSAPLTVGASITGRIDWGRRFDHMQQHAGEHMLAGLIHQRYAGYTVGLHLGAEISTIDVAMPEGETRIPAGEVAQLEVAINGMIQQNLPIKCWFPAAEELKTLNLRKPPAVSEHVRIVKIGEDELVACGGTHPSTTGQIGLFKIVDVRPSKGKMRMAFLCGMRAFRAFQEHFDAATKAAEILSSKVDAVPEGVERLKERERAANGEILRLSREMAFDRATEAKPIILNGALLYSMSFEGLDAQSLREIAAKLISENRSVALLEATGGETRQLVFACSEGISVNMGALLSECAKEHGGKGGGKPDFAQGGAREEGALLMAEARVKEALI